MQNLDKIKQKKDELRSELAEAIRENDEGKIGASMDNWMQFVSETVMSEANGLMDATDRSILAARGVRQLTAEETKFYESFIANARQDAQTVITNITSALPQTVIDSVMDDMKAAYPLLDLIDFTNTGAAIKWVLNAQGAQAATWDELNTEITKDLAGAVSVVDLTQRKLSAFMFVTQDMLALGPQWVDRYVRAILADSLAAGLETGIVDGNGLKAPIGMTRAFTGSLHPTNGYDRKAATSVVTLDPITYGGLLATLAVDGNTGKQRPVSRALLIVNPTDYFTKIMPATTVLTRWGRMSAVCCRSRRTFCSRSAYPPDMQCSASPKIISWASVQAGAASSNTAMSTSLPKISAPIRSSSTAPADRMTSMPSSTSISAILCRSCRPFRR